MCHLLFFNTHKEVHDYFGYTEYFTVPLIDGTEYFWNLRDDGDIRYRETPCKKRDAYEYSYGL